MTDILCDIINDDSNESKTSSYDDFEHHPKKIGMIMEGIWKNGRLNTYGRTIDFKGNMYFGDYFEGEKHGYGTFIWTNGDIYEGQWNHDKQDGKGLFFMYETSEAYIGLWHNGQIKPILSEFNQQINFWKNG